jgi:hypothetical protein
MSLSAYSSELEAEVLPEFEEELEGEWEAEEETEFGEEELEGEISPIRKVYPDAAMEHMGAMAAEAESEEEAAEQFLPLIGMAASKLLPVVAKAVAPMARKALPRIARAVTKVTPQLTRSVGRIAKRLYRQPGTRPLLRAVPTIARRTIHNIARQVAHNRPVTARSAARTLVTQARRVLGSPGQRANILRRHRLLDRRFHHRWGRGMVRPHGWRYGQPTVGSTVHGAAPTHHGAVAPPFAPVVPGQPSVTYGRVVRGQCVCPSAAPAYCSCCGQVLR